MPPQPRRQYREARRLDVGSVGIPEEWRPIGEFGTIPAGAITPPGEISRLAGGASALVGGAFAVPFDRVVLFQTNDLVGMAAGVEFDLVGSVAAQLAGGAIAGAPKPLPVLGPVPASYRGVLDGFAPFVTDLVGNQAIVSPRQLGFNIIWRLRVDGQLASPYDNVGFIVTPWHQLSTQPLLELEQGDELTCTVQCVAAPYAQIGQLGVRLRGRWVPWDDSKGTPRTPQGY